MRSVRDDLDGLVGDLIHAMAGGVSPGSMTGKPCSNGKRKQFAAATAKCMLLRLLGWKKLQNRREEPPKSGNRINSKKSG